MIATSATKYRDESEQVAQERTRHHSPLGGVAAVMVLAAFTSGCGSRISGDSSNRGSDSSATLTSIENTYLVPRFEPGSCAIQVGSVATLAFTVTNNRPADAEQLTRITSTAADTITLAPNQSFSIPPRSSVAVGQPMAHGESTAVDQPVTATVTGLNETATPGTSIPITWHFSVFGDLTLRTPVEACPTQTASRETSDGQGEAVR